MGRARQATFRLGPGGRPQTAPLRRKKNVHIQSPTRNPRRRADRCWSDSSGRKPGVQGDLKNVFSLGVYGLNAVHLAVVAEKLRKKVHELSRSPEIVRDRSLFVRKENLPDSRAAKDRNALRRSKSSKRLRDGPRSFRPMPPNAYPS